jgi:hypothetical protein
VLASVSEKLTRGGHRVEIVVPLNSDCTSYLVACGFVRQVKAFAEVEAPPWVFSGSPSGSPSVLPLYRLDEEADVGWLHERAGDFLRSGGWKQRDPILGTIKEISVNVFHHAEYPVGWIMGQLYRNSYQDSEYVEIAIAVAGRGIRRSLTTRYPELVGSPEGTVLERMLREHLSSATGEYRGTGYYILQHAAEQLDGSFSLRSGSGAVIRKRGGAVQRKENLPAWPGTQLKARFTIPPSGLDRPGGQRLHSP